MVSAHSSATQSPSMQQGANGLFRATATGALRIGFGPANGLAVVAPLPLAVTLDALESAAAQREFLEFIGTDAYLVAYDQRGAGSSQPLPAGATIEMLGEDIWHAADAADVERAVLYGVFDAGASVIEAARQQPERVLGLILNFVPPAFGRLPGVPPEAIDAWRMPDNAIDTRLILESLGLAERDVAALSTASTARRGIAERLALLDGWSAAGLGSCDAPILIIEPQRRAFFAGWGDALRAYQPGARVVYSQRGARALGAIDAFVSSLTDELGRRASYLTAEQARTVSAVEEVGNSTRTILVPVDEAFSGVRAVDLACHIAEAQGASIAIASVVIVPRVREIDDVPPEDTERAENLLRMMAATAARHGVAYDTFVQRTRGYVDGIVLASKRIDADMVVLPNPALSMRRDGSVLEELFTRSLCEVLVDRSRRAR